MKQTRAIALIGVLFFIFGFVTWLNGILIPYLRIACELDNFQSYLVAFAFYIATIVMALPSSGIIRRTGFRNAMMVGLFIMAGGALLFVPAASMRSYPLFLFGLFVIGGGMTVLQTASNPYISVMGPRESAARRISLMGIFNKTAGILSPLILGAIVLKGNEDLEARLAAMDAVQRAAELDALAARVIVPYCVMAAILFGLGVFVRFSGLPEINPEADNQAVAGSTPKTSVWQFPNLILGLVSLFLYVGVEVMAGDTIISYGLSQGFPLTEAKVFTSYTLAAMVIGYILSIVLMPKWISQEKALTVSAVLGLVFTAGALMLDGFASVLCIALLGFANAVMWPAHWPLALHGLGKFTRIGASLLVMGIAGGALLPLAYGYLVDVFNAQQAYWLLVPCYLFILYYAVAGHKKLSWRATPPEKALQNS
ncbi:glucose/galactose transporter [Catalinimonas alkaloidigena]|uniref:Glucose/galactose transporter n=1 Tax=Catalinimonas alkaloidigena TaxID=1075417 RepID=A0A1G9MSY7_9BACT|nr:sugar MFS transporter [Catalinimonas alkaloidigena]SDL77111.1 glucose/galactose transporter [Catalinimonas alkaloidigena]